MLAPLLLCALAFGPTADPPPPGRRIELDGAMLFIPEGYRPDGRRVDVVLHLHGAPSVIEPAIVKTGWRAVLVEFNRKGLSSVYTKPFSDPELLPSLLEKTREAVAREGLVPDPEIGRVTVSSFSAGFGGVREMLNVPAHFRRIDALYLADSLYCGYLGDPSKRDVDPEKMSGFLRFAQEAAAGRKTLVLTHSAQVPEGYASTTETADYLIRALDGSATPAKLDRGEGWVQSRRFENGGLLILGFDGTGPEDHMRHLRRIADVWRANASRGGERP